MSLIALLVLVIAEKAQSQTNLSIPHLEKQGLVTHLIVDGKPWLSLAGELLNNAASTAENVRPVWADIAKANLNTVLVGVGWGWTEPEEGKYDNTALDGVLQDARNNNLHVVLLWFGSWKNGTSSYAPVWVKRNWEKYPIARDKDGKGMEILSTMSATNRDADARAFAALMRHVREVDSGTHTVIMIQLENEVGLIGDSRDRCKEANDAFAGHVPKALMDYLQKNKNVLLPETKKLWDAAGGRTSGTWAEVFGKGTGADDAFMAWHYAQYMNRIAELGKKEYPLPIFVNAWLKQPMYPEPGNYPSGGPQAHNHDFWVAGANLNIRFSSTLAEAPMASLAAVKEGRFENGVWVVGRHLAGDDTGMGADQRASLRLTAKPGIVRVSLYCYR